MAHKPAHFTSHVTAGARRQHDPDKLALSYFRSSCFDEHVGYDRVTFERFDTKICIGKNVDDAIEFAMALGPAGEIIRLAGEEGEQLKPEVVVALREALTPYLQDSGVWAPSSTWFITAHNAE